MILVMDENEEEDDEDFRPILRRRYSKEGYWEEYDGKTKTWSRICDNCSNKVCLSSISHCALHAKKSKTTKMKKKKKEMNIPEQV